MSETYSTNLGLPFIAPAQAQKHVTHNEALNALDALVQLSVLDRDLATPPPSPSQGDRYLVADAGTGDWSGKDGQIAAFQDGVWVYFIPQAGWIVWIADENLLLIHNGTEPVEIEPRSSSQFGVNTLADSTNRLAVKSDVVLHSHDDVTPGNGSARHLINKASDTDTASVLFQTNWSGRAEFGLSGNDDWRVKVSSDGSDWRNVLHADRATGIVTFPSGVSGLREQLTANRIYYVRTDGDDGNDGLSDNAGGGFATLQKAFDVIGNLDTGISTIHLYVRTGSYAGGILKPPLGPGTLIIEGDRTTPSNVTITSGAGNRGIWVQRPGTFEIRGFQFDTTSTNIDCGTAIGVSITARDCAFAGGSAGVAVGKNNSLSIVGIWSLTGTYSSFISADRSYVSTWGSTITFGPSAEVTTAYFWTGTHTSALLSNTTWTGTLTGRRCNMGANCVVNTQGGGDASIPGTVASIVGAFSTIT